MTEQIELQNRLKESAQTMVKALPIELQLARKMLPRDFREGMDVGLALSVSFNALKEQEKQAFFGAIHKALEEVVPTFSEDSLNNPQIIAALMLIDHALSSAAPRTLECFPETPDNTADAHAPQQAPSETRLLPSG